MRRGWFIVGCFGVLVLVATILSTALHFWLDPSHDRVWELGQERLPVLRLEGESLIVEQLRNFTWSTVEGHEEADRRYETRVYRLAQIQGVDVFVSHFSSFEGLAHIFLSFTFADSEPLVLSVESRREIGETFSPWQGMLARYELMVVAGTERDLIGLRANIRRERLYRYPTVATPEISKKLLLGLMTDMQSIEKQPRFYHTLSNNCTNFITKRVTAVANVKFPLTWKTIFPGYFETVLLKLGLIERTDSTVWNKNVYRVERVPTSNDPEFSRHLRDPAFQKGLMIQ